MNPAPAARMKVRLWRVSASSRTTWSTPPSRRFSASRRCSPCASRARVSASMPMRAPGTRTRASQARWSPAMGERHLRLPVCARTERGAEPLEESQVRDVSHGPSAGVRPDAEVQSHGRRRSSKVEQREPQRLAPLQTTPGGLGHPDRTTGHRLAQVMVETGLSHLVPHAYEGGLSRPSRSVVTSLLSRHEPMLIRLAYSGLRGSFTSGFPAARESLTARPLPLPICPRRRGCSPSCPRERDGRAPTSVRHAQLTRGAGIPLASANRAARLGPVGPLATPRDPPAALLAACSAANVAGPGPRRVRGA